MTQPDICMPISNLTGGDVSEIVYPVFCGDPHTDHVFDASDNEVCDCVNPDFTYDEHKQHARRIAAALNATRHLTVEQLEACDDLRPARELSVELRALRRTWRESLGLTPEPINSGDAAKGE